MSGRTNRKSRLTISLFLLAIGCTTASGRTVYVNADDTGANNDSSRADALSIAADWPSYTYSFVVDQTRSNLNVQMTVRTIAGSSSDSDSSPVSGWVDVRLTPQDSRYSPFSALQVADLGLEVSEQFNLTFPPIPFTGKDFSLDMDRSGPEVSVSAGGSFLQLVSLLSLRGTFAFYGLPFDVVSDGEAALGGTVQQDGETISLELSFDGQFPLDQSDLPPLVQSVNVSYSATIVATAQSVGPPAGLQVDVPDVVGMAQADAESAITAVGLSVGMISAGHSDTVPEGHIISQDPAAGTSAAEGFEVELLISLGPVVCDPVAHWKFDDGSGNTAIDSSGNVFDITLHNTTWEDGVFGGAVHFHGVTGGYVENFKYSDNAITVCAWVWHDAFRIDKIERYLTVSPEVAVIRKEANGALHFYIKIDGNLQHLWVSDVLMESQWYHVAGTWDGLTQRLYVDGVEISSQALGGVLGNTSNVEMSSDGNESFNGMLDDVRIYNRALTQDSIQVIMQGEEFPFAFSPTPPDGATLVDIPVVLSWMPCFGAQLYRVYFGENFDDVNNAADGVPQLTANFTPGPLERGKTYYWRVDEVNDLDPNSPWKGDVWSFTTVRTGGEWTYDGGIFVGVYYYPWYGPTAHRISQSLRGHLVPEQTAELGEYDNASQEVITRHIDYSHRANIHFWACSWWGPGTYVDNVLRYHILPHKYAGELRYAIVYESTGRLGSFSNPDYSNLVPDFQYFTDNYFSDPNYLKLDGRPVVFIYLTRVYFRQAPGYDALAALRAAFPNIYIIADDIFGRNYSSANASKWDAVTAYDVYGQTLQSYGSTGAALNQLESILSEAKAAANSVGVGLIPFAAPGFNDKGVRGGHDGAPRYFEDDPSSSEGDLFRAMLRNVVVPKVDPLAENILMITSFNEWHEDTQIEPTMGTGGATNIDDSATGSDYTQGDYYTDYGYLYLDILSQETSFLQVDFLSEALDTALNFTTGGGADWFSQTTTFYNDGDAAQSGDISDNHESWMQTTVSGAGTVSFYWKVSSEGDYYDYLEFYIDGSLQDRISGTVDWQQMTYTITASGPHTLEWRYTKDPYVSSGSDCGWVDKVEWGS